MYPLRLVCVARNGRGAALVAAFSLFSVLSSKPCLAGDAGPSSTPAYLRIAVVVLPTVETTNPAASSTHPHSVSYSLQTTLPPNIVQQKVSREMSSYPPQSRQRGQNTPAIVE